MQLTDVLENPATAHADDWQKRLAVRAIVDKGNCLFATETIRAGEIIGYYEGNEIAADTMYSVRLDGRIIDGGDGPLRYMAHACEPSAWFKDKRRWLYALKDIAAGDEVTIDYLHTEPVISAPFTCHCGSAKCRGAIRTPDTASDPS